MTSCVSGQSVLCVPFLPWAPWTCSCGVSVLREMDHIWGSPPIDVLPVPYSKLTVDLGLFSVTAKTHQHRTAHVFIHSLNINQVTCGVSDTVLGTQHTGVRNTAVVSRKPETTMEPEHTVGMIT